VCDLIHNYHRFLFGVSLIHARQWEVPGHGILD